MHDIKELERKWKRYQRKRRRPVYIAITLFALLPIFFYAMKHYTVSSFVPSSIFSQTKSAEALDLPHVDKNNKILLNDTIVEIEKKQKNHNAKNTAPVEPIEEIPILEEPIEKTRHSYAKKAAKRQKQHKKINLHIVETSSISAYKDVEKRFYQAHDIADSLFLAKGYYSHGNYKKAEYWAFQTNKVNQNIEESWIIFVKSKWKQGYKNEAIHVLESYLKRTHSKAAKILLEKLKK